jgi:alkaline phosphatase D
MDTNGNAPAPWAGAQSGIDVHALDLDRRRFLGRLAGVAGLAAVATLPVDRAAAEVRPRSGNYAFSLGVASGDPRPRNVVLWTRLAPEPFRRRGGMPDVAVGVDWSLAADPEMRRTVRTGRALAMPELAHSVHVELDGLEPDREYFYQFRYRGRRLRGRADQDCPAAGARQRDSTSPSPRARHGRTATTRRTGISRRKSSTSWCTSGDYVYEGAVPAHGGHRRVRVPRSAREAPQSLRSGGPAMRSTRAIPTCNARTRAFRGWSPGTTTRWSTTMRAIDCPSRTSALSARPPTRPTTSTSRCAPRRSRIREDMRLYRRVGFGDLARFHVLDGRQYRDVPPVRLGRSAGVRGGLRPDCHHAGRSAGALARGRPHALTGALGRASPTTS